MSDKFATFDKYGRTTGTPCVRICKLDEESSLCSGCYRNLEEIEGWSEYTDEQKEQIMIAIEIRKELLCEDHGQS